MNKLSKIIMALSAMSLGLFGLPSGKDILLYLLTL